MPQRFQRGTRVIAWILAIGLFTVLTMLITTYSYSLKATQHTASLEPGDTLTINCPTELQEQISGVQSATIVCASGTTTPLAQATNTPSANAAANTMPVAGQECPAWVHDRYVTTGPDGKIYPTWHPPVDAQYGCYFNHEHGSDPHAYVGFAASGMPAFGYTVAQVGMEEPHNGFKVYVSNDDLNGRAWMITLHQGTGSPRRALVQFHTLDWHISTTAGKPLVDIHMLADFGYASPNCRTNEAIPRSATGRAFSEHDEPRRFIPTTDCVEQTVYEQWNGRVRIGTFFEALPNFDIDNATTAVNLAKLDDIRFMCEFHNRDEDCSSANTRWTGNKRGVIHPGQFVKNTTGSPEIYTDAYGTIVGHDSPGAIRQYITTSGWDTRQCCGNEVVFKIQTYSNGIYIANPLEVAGSAEFGVGRHHWPN